MPATSRRPSNAAAIAAYLASVVATATNAAAQPSATVIAALAPGASRRDARLAVAVGPGGEVFEPDGRGAWIRHNAGGIADEVVRVARLEGSELALIAVTRRGAAFEWREGTWSRIHVSKKMPGLLGGGDPPLIAVGTTVFAFREGEVAAPVALPRTARPITALGASSMQRITIATDRGLQRLSGTTWRPIPKSPRTVDALLSDRWAIAERGLVALDIPRTLTWPAGFRIANAVAVTRDVVVAVGGTDTALEVVTVRAGRLVQEPIPNFGPDRTSSIAGIVADTAGRMVVALRDGQLAVRDRSSWTTTTVRTELDPARPGSPPAALGP